jgi:FtsH-binding integral membrane protein
MLRLLRPAARCSYAAALWTGAAPASAPAFRLSLARSSGGAGAQLTRSSARSRLQSTLGYQQQPKPPASTLAIAAAAGLGVLGLGLAGGMIASGAPVGTTVTQYRDDLWPQYVRDRVGSTFVAFGSGLGMTAAAAFVAHRQGTVYRLMLQRPGMFLAGSLVATIGSMLVTHATPKENKPLKYGSFALFNTCVGLSLAPVALMGGPLVARAAAYTGGVVGSLALVAANSPSDKYLWMAGPLAMGLGAVVVASLGGYFFPAAAAAPMLHKVSVYGGLAVFSGFTLYDCSRIVAQARALPPGAYDAINSSISIYLDTINVFVRIVDVLGHRDRRR